MDNSYLIYGHFIRHYATLKEKQIMQLRFTIRFFISFFLSSLAKSNAMELMSQVVPDQQTLAAYYNSFNCDEITEYSKTNTKNKKRE